MPDPTGRSPQEQQSANPGTTHEQHPTAVAQQTCQPLDDFLNRARQFPLAERRAAVLADQADRWQRGERVPVETYLQHRTELELDDEAILDLIYGEFVQRSERGERPGTDEFQERFPEYRERLQRLFLLDQALVTRQETTERSETSADQAESPASIGRYAVIAELGRGGQAVVYRAVHPALNKDVVIKLSRAPWKGDSAERDRLLAEGRLLAELEHPGLARVFDLDFYLGRPFLVLEYVRGRNLDQQRRTAALPVSESIRVVAQVARSLAAVHRQGIVHRDVTPRNIMLDEQGQPRLIDFGLAHWRAPWEVDAEQRSITGTIAFMAPEQANGEGDRITAPQ